MYASERLLDHYFTIAKQAVPNYTDSILASGLGVSPQTVSNWRRSKQRIPEYVVAMMAERIGHPALPWLLALQCQHAQDGRNQAAWRSVLEKVGGLPEFAP